MGNLSAAGRRSWTAFGVVLLIAGAAPAGAAPTTTVTAPGPARASRPSVAVPTSIDATGRRDVTAALQKFLARVPDGRVVQFRRNGSYRVDGTIVVAGRHELTFAGNGARVFAATRGSKTRSQWYVLDGSNIVFRDLEVQGANPHGGTSENAYVRKLETQHGFRLEGVNGVELDHVTVSDVYGDFVYVGRDPRRAASRNVWIHDSNFMRNGRQGIAVVAATNVIVEHNRFDQTRRSTIDLEPNARSWHVSDVFVLDNTVGAGRLLFVASHGQGPVDDVVIAGNALQDHALTIDVVAGGKKRRSNWIIRRNTSDTTVQSRPLRFSGVDGVLIQGNRQRVDGSQPAVALSDVCGARVAGNDFGPAGARVRRTGKVCAAPLVIPTPAAMFGRGSTVAPAAPGPRGAVRAAPRRPATGAPAPGGSSVPPAVAVVGIALAAAIVIGVVLLFGRRRRRRAAR